MKILLLFLFIFFSLIQANEPKTINAVLSLDKPPFIFGQTTQKGIEADLIKEIFNSLGYKVNIIQKSKNYIQTILDKENQYDIVATITPTNNKLFYSKSFTSYENFVITRADEHININTIDDLKNIKFVTWNGAYNDLGKKFYKLFNPLNGTSKLSYHDNLSQKNDVKMFFSKKVDAIIIDKTIFNWFKIHLGNNDKYSFHSIFKKKKTYPVTFRSKELRDIFNKELERFKKNGRYDEIIEFYETQNFDELLKYTSLITNLSKKFIVNQQIKKLKKLLPLFITHPDILAIKIKDTNGNIILNIKNKISSIKNFSTISKKIYYTNKDSEILLLGDLQLFYKKSYKSSNGTLIQPLKYYKTSNEFNYIKENYEKLKLLNNNNKIILSPKEKRYLKKHKTITVHNEQNWAPYNFNENGIPKGFVIDYIDLIAKKLNINIKYIKDHTWSEYLGLIKTEQIDIISNIAKTKEREKYINFTKSFIVSKKAIFSDTLDVSNISDLNGKTVAVPEQFYIDYYLHKNYPNIKLKKYKDVQECLFAVINKEADALIENYAVVNYLIKKNGLSIKYINIKNDKELTTHLSIGVRKSQSILRDILIKAQNSITKKEFEKIESRWFGLSNNRIEPFNKKEKIYVKNKKVLKVCTNPNWYPIEFTKNGKPKGITIDILTKISKQVGFKLKFIKTNSWSQSQIFLKEKKCDILSSASKTKKREQYANFTKPYLSYDLAIVTKNDKPVVDKLSNIIDKPMSRKVGSGLSMILKQKYPNIKINETITNLDTFRDIQNDKSYFTLTTFPVLSYNQKRYDLNNLYVSGYSDIKLRLRFAIRNDDKILLSIMNKSIDLVSKDVIKVINNKWTTQEIIKKTDYFWIWLILFISSVIILIILVAYRKQKLLKKEILKLNNSLKDKVKYEVKKNEEQQLMMLQQSRLAQMGEMISMIAHQWRQPLNTLAILNQTIILKYNRKKLDDKVIEYFKQNSKKQIENMSNTIDDFRNFFKPRKDKLEFSINKNIINVINMLDPIFTKVGIVINFKYKEDITMLGYGNELGQVLLNILNNSKDAIVENDIKQGTINIYLENKENKVILTITDNAGGIPKDIIDKIFDPYFSTKHNKNGTGLGLYMSKIIIQEHFKGKIEVKNDKNGAVFNILL